jgi:putative tryptophan/tyrosine transport system substrate-binding protein
LLRLLFSLYCKVYGYVALNLLPIGLLLFLLLPSSLLATERRADDLPRVVVIDSTIAPQYDELRLAMLQQLAAIGWHNGKNFHLEHFTLDHHRVALQQRLIAMRQEPVAAIVTIGTAATLLACDILWASDQAVIFAAVPDPLSAGLIRGFNQPPLANFTGIGYAVPLTARLRFVRQLLPLARTIGLIYTDSADSLAYNEWLLRLLREEAEFRRFRLILRPLQPLNGADDEISMAAAAIPVIQELNQRVDLFLLTINEMGRGEALTAVMARHAAQPVIGLVRDDVMAGRGALAVVYPVHQSIGEQGGVMVASLLAGQPFKQLLPQPPARYGFAINLAAANRARVRIPLTLLQLAGNNIIQ